MSQPEPIPWIETREDRPRVASPPTRRSAERVNRVNPSRPVHQMMPGEVADVILTLRGFVTAEECLGDLDPAGGQLALGQVKVRAKAIRGRSGR